MRIIDLSATLGHALYLQNESGTGLAPWRLPPSAGEEGHYAAVKFTHATKVMHISEVSYEAPNSNENGVNCTVHNPRTMDLYVASGALPPANATPAHTIVVPGIPNAPVGAIRFDVKVWPPLTVPVGQSLFVAIRLDGTHPTDVDCLLLEGGDVTERVETEFWSDAADKPFPWVNLDVYTKKKIIMDVSGITPLQ